MRVYTRVSVYDVCACMSVCTCVQAHIQVCEHACEGQRATLGVFLNHSRHYYYHYYNFLFTYLFSVEGCMPWYVYDGWKKAYRNL